MSKPETRAGIRTPINSASYEAYLPVSGRPMVERLHEIDHLLDPGKTFEDTKLLVRLINLECAMHLDVTEIGVFALHLHNLKTVKRYRNDIHLAPEQFGNVGEHSAKVVVQSDDLFRQTNLDNEMLAHMRRNYHIGTYMHDLGESLGEFYSFAEEQNQRVTKRLDPDTRLALEQDIARFISYVALYAVETASPDLYFNTITEMRETCGVKPEGGLSIDPYEAVKRIRGYIAGFEYPPVSAGRAADIRDRVEHRQYGMMRFYQQAEEYKGVGGPAVKIGQIIEGNDKFISMAREFRENAVPYGLATSKRILGAYVRTEPPIVGLINHAVDVPAQFEIAMLRQREVYANLLSHITIEPYVLDRRVMEKGATVSDPEPVEPGTRTISKDRLSVHFNLAAEEREAARNDNFDLGPSAALSRPTISARTRLLLYAAAWLCADYAPLDKEPLVLKRAAPDMLAPYMSVLNGALEGRTVSDMRRLYEGQPVHLKAVDDLEKNRERIEGFFKDFREYRSLSEQAIVKAASPTIKM